MVCGTAHFSTQRCPAAEEAPNRLHIEGKAIRIGTAALTALKLEPPRKQLALAKPAAPVREVRSGGEKKGRPSGRGVGVLVRYQPEALAKLDAYREAEGGLTRPEAIRAITEEKLG